MYSPSPPSLNPTFPASSGTADNEAAPSARDFNSNRKPSGVERSCDAFTRDTVPLTAPRFCAVCCPGRRTAHKSMAPSRPTLTMQRAVLENPRASRGMMSSALHLPPGPQETPPGTEIRNPADLVNQFAFLARVLPFQGFTAFLLPFNGASAGRASSIEVRATACAEYTW